jgi:hypothetical protein
MRSGGPLTLGDPHRFVQTSLPHCGLELDRLLAEILLITAIAAALAAAAWITVMLLTACLSAILAAFLAAVLPYGGRDHLQRLHRIRGSSLVITRSQERGSFSVAM